MTYDSLIALLGIICATVALVGWYTLHESIWKSMPWYQRVAVRAVAVAANIAIVIMILHVHGVEVSLYGWGGG